MGLNELRDEHLQRIEKFNSTLIETLRSPRQLLLSFTPNGIHFAVATFILWGFGLAIVFASVVSVTVSGFTHVDLAIRFAVLWFLDTSMGSFWLTIYESLPRWLAYTLFGISVALGRLSSDQSVPHGIRNFAWLGSCLSILLLPKLIFMAILVFAGVLSVAMAVAAWLVWIALCVFLLLTANAALAPFHAGHFLKKNGYVKHAVTTGGLLITLAGAGIAFVGTP